MALIASITIAQPALAAPELDQGLKRGELQRPSWEVRASSGPVFATGVTGWSWAGGAAGRTGPLGLGFWFERREYDAELRSLFLGASLRSFMLQEGRWDPYVKLDLGLGGTEGQCSGLGMQLGAGLDFYVLDFLKLGPSTTLFMTAASCSAAHSTAFRGHADPDRGIIAAVDVALAPAERAPIAGGPYRP